mmetsp:Transcript_7293/g.16543  ORF Transcript_7293/g.16543 Transcript_7293/m.16543 type:complete len:372 (+) Transcript_7293:128-1243(+)
MDRDELVSDRNYDEAIAVETDDDDVSTPASSEVPSPNSQQQTPQGMMGRGSPQKAPRPLPDEDDGSEEESSSEESGSTSDSSNAGDGGGEGKAALSANAYNPDEFKHLSVSSEVEELFQYITRYKPHTIELDSTLKPFIPELIPSIGEVDAFIKMPRPDNAQSSLGTTCLDEPTMNPTDPSILDLQLRSLSKNQDLQPMEVRSIENAEKNPKEIENWVKRIDELNRSKPAPTVQYSRRMPDIEQLMQVWPAEFEEYILQNSLPELADLELDLPSYVRILASILDVPVYSQLTETLHVIFTLYSEFKSNQHFSKADTLGNQEQYNFGPIPNFQGGGTMSAGATGQVFGAQTAQSMAPSRAPSPVGQGPQIRM